MSENGSEAMKLLADIQTDIDGLVDRANQLCVDFVDASISTHGAIANLCNVPADKIESLSLRILQSCALSDRNTKNSIDLMGHTLSCVRDLLVAAINGCIESRAVDRAQIARMKMRVDDLEGRIREHALHNESVRERVWAITDGKCFYCDVELVRGSDCQGERANVFHIDHLVPKAAGGPDHISNYVPACQSCNIAKGDKPFAEFTRKPAAPKLTVVA